MAELGIFINPIIPQSQGFGILFFMASLKIIVPWIVTSIRARIIIVI
jgi:hypothetical protein